MSETILIIDDHPEALRLTGIILKRGGYSVLEASSGPEGLDIARSSPPDLVLLDVMMPGMDGIEVCRQLRANPQLTAVPIVMFSARSHEGDKLQAFQAGADAYVVKPLRPKMLVERIRTILTATAVPAIDTAAAQQSRTIVVAGVSAPEESWFASANLSLVLAEMGYHAVLVSAEATAPPETDNIKTVVWGDDGALSADALRALTQPDNTSTIALVNLDVADLTRDKLTALAPDQIVVCFAGELEHLTAAQSMLQQLRLNAPVTTGLHALLVDLRGTAQLGAETASSLIRYPVLDAIHLGPQDASTDTLAEHASASHPQFQRIARRLISHS